MSISLQKISNLHDPASNHGKTEKLEQIAPRDDLSEQYYKFFTPLPCAHERPFKLFTLEDPTVKVAFSSTSSGSL
ncbi:MAG: hypothetical protein HQM01_10985 [Magnetococcales bacterium]|nr:hypothetical protein [Magnetococcales bacterium]